MPTTPVTPVHAALPSSRPDVVIWAPLFRGLIAVNVSKQAIRRGSGEGTAETMFTPFTQRSTDRSGLGLGLSIAKRNVEADGGTLTVKNSPGTGCVLTMKLPRHEVQRQASGAGP